MSLLDVVRAGVKVADGVTKPLQATVSFWRYASSDGEGERTFVPARNQPGVQLRAIVDWMQRSVRTATGELSVSRSSVLFLDVAALSAATNGNGVDDNDVIVLPDGTTGPILDMKGFVDAGTGHPIATEVYLG